MKSQATEKRAAKLGKVWAFAKNNPVPYIAVAGLLLSGALHFHQPAYARWVWLATLIGGGAPLVWRTLRGMAQGKFASVLGDPPNAKERPDIRFASMMAHSDPVALARMANDVQLGQFGIPIGRRFPLKDAASAQETAAQGGVGKVLLLAIYP